MKRREKTKSLIEQFLALSEVEKKKEIAPFEKQELSVKTRPLTRAERRRWKHIQRGLRQLARNKTS
jgi:hypothetical protein